MFLLKHLKKIKGHLVTQLFRLGCQTRLISQLQLSKILHLHFRLLIVKVIQKTQVQVIRASCLWNTLELRTMIVNYMQQGLTTISDLLFLGHLRVLNRLLCACLDEVLTDRCIILPTPGRGMRVGPTLVKQVQWMFDG